jgi:hypothetical protein
MKTRFQRLRLAAAIFVFWCIIAFIFFVLRTRIDTQNLAIQELSEKGFYAYILPEKTQEQLGLDRKISIYSFDWHCGRSRENNWNPLKITYTNASDRAIFSVTISPHDVLFDESKESYTVTLDLPWIPTHKVVYYNLQNGVEMKAKDLFGLDVVISSGLNIDDIVSLSRQLEYVGADSDRITNPWDVVCK